MIADETRAQEMAKRLMNGELLPEKGRQSLPAEAQPYIYFIRETRTGHVKIGIAKNVRLRLGFLQCGNSSELEIVGVVPGDASDEANLHDRFARLCIRGEWFDAAQDLLDFIQNEAKGEMFEEITKRARYR